MNDTDKIKTVLSEREQLAARWDKVAFRAQNSAFEDLTILCLSRNAGTRPWLRPDKEKDDTVGRYVYLSLDELYEFEKLDEKSVAYLIELIESVFLFETEVQGIGRAEDIEAQANATRMRYVEEFGLDLDFPVRFANLNADLRELCRAEEIETLTDLMHFLDRLTDKAWVGGEFQHLQNAFAYGGEERLAKLFPFRPGHRGFHLPEALSICLNRIPNADLQAVYEYHERRRRRSRFGQKRMPVPQVVERVLLPEVFELLHYFSKRQRRLLLRLYDSVYLCRELMYLRDPQTEGILHWLLHLALGVFKNMNVGDPELAEEIDAVNFPEENDIIRELRQSLNEA